MQLAERTRLVKQLAREHGFDFVGIARARRLDEEAARLQEWLNAGYQGEMSYMESYFEKRIDPSKLVPGARSVVSLLYNYFTERKQEPGSPRISMYALGKDYHKVIRKKLKQLLSAIRHSVGDVQGRGFVDSAPLLERDLARRAGVGWTGKNTLLINPRAGSYFFLAELVVDLELQPDAPIRDHCGTCRRCIDACPTDAIADGGYVVDARKCISYLTIELKGEIPEEFAGQTGDWIFGCDICQEVCPWNRFSSKHNEPAFEPGEELLRMERNDWFELGEEAFELLFEGSAVKRAKYAGLKRNIDFYRKGMSDGQIE